MNNMVLRIILVMSVFGLISIAFAENDAKVTETDNQTADTTAIDNAEDTGSEIIFATYFHGDVRCATCRKLEAYSEEALKAAFGIELADSTLVWRTINYDTEGNQHYLDDYGLYTKALILSRVRDNSEIEWVNLSKIWELVGNKDKFLKYVQDETRAFLNKESD